VRCARLSIVPKKSRVWVAAPPSGGLEAKPPKTPRHFLSPQLAKAKQIDPAIHAGLFGIDAIP
jgi:hypothetical protein